MDAESGDWLVRPAVDFGTARAVLAQDRIANVYALGDLEPPYDDYTTVAVAGRGGAPEAACLVVRHPAFTGVVTHGHADGVQAILPAIDLPPTAYLDLPDAHRSVVERFYTFTDPHHRRLMATNPESFRPFAGYTAGVVRLEPADLDDLVDLYAGYDASAFHPAQLEHGVFFGVRDGHRLLAAGGTPDSRCKAASRS